MKPHRRPRHTRAPQIVLGVVALGVVLVARAFAQTPPELQKIVSLTWSAPPECPDASYVMAELGRQLSGAPIAPEKHISARATVTRGEGKSWHLRLTTESGEQRGDRALDAESCRAAADATALIVAMAVDPSRVLARTDADAGAPVPPLLPPPSASASPSATPTATAEPPPTAPAAPTASATAAPPAPPPATAPSATAPATAPPVTPGGAGSLKAFALSVGLVVDDGALSGVNPGVRGAVAWIPRRARVELGASFLPASRVHVAGSSPPRGADLDLALGDLHGCYAVLEGRVELGPCVGVELGWFRGAGFGVSSASKGATMWAALLAGGLLSFRATERISLRLSLDAVAPLSRPSFVLDAPATGGATLRVHKSAAIVGRALLGAELRF